MPPSMTAPLLAPVGINEMQNIDLLGAQPYVVIKNQILFRQEGGGYVITAINPNDSYTIADYKQLPEKAPYELIKGKLVFMPSPVVYHQRICLRMSAAMQQYANSRALGEVFIAPLDVYLDAENVFQPDVFFIAKERSAIVQRFIQGAPDVVIEVLSAHTRLYDRQEKAMVYCSSGVKEYWIIDPEEKTVALFQFERGEPALKKQLRSPDEAMVSAVLEGFTILLKEIFA